MKTLNPRPSILSIGIAILGFVLLAGYFLKPQTAQESNLTLGLCFSIYGIIKTFLEIRTFNRETREFNELLLFLQGKTATYLETKYRQSIYCCQYQEKHLCFIYTPKSVKFTPPVVPKDLVIDTEVIQQIKQRNFIQIRDAI